MVDVLRPRDGVRVRSDKCCGRGVSPHGHRPTAVRMVSTRRRAWSTAFRYYPDGTALSGFCLGPRVGLFHRNIYAAPESGMDVDGHERLDSDMELDDDSGLFLGVGVELGYAWLLGAEKHLSISMGGGATRVFNGEAVPMIRFVNVGWAF